MLRIEAHLAIDRPLKTSELTQTSNVYKGNLPASNNQWSGFASNVLTKAGDSETKAKKKTINVVWITLSWGS